MRRPPFLSLPPVDANVHQSRHARHFSSFHPTQHVRLQIHYRQQPSNHGLVESPFTIGSQNTTVCYLLGPSCLRLIRYPHCSRRHHFHTDRLTVRPILFRYAFSHPASFFAFASRHGRVKTPP